MYAVDKLTDLEEAILPFFEQHPLCVKRSDFETFAAIVRSISAKEHLSAAGFERVVRAAYGMNARGKQRPGPSTRCWQDPQRLYARPSSTRRDETVRSAWRHAESGRNDLARSPFHGER